MAPSREKPAHAPNGKQASDPAPAVVAATSIAAAVPAASNAATAQRLLREAAWGRMFGRMESRNPFTRSR